jgi:hypothetical protein
VEHWYDKASSTKLNVDRGIKMYTLVFLCDWREAKFQDTLEEPVPTVSNSRDKQKIKLVRGPRTVFQVSAGFLG